eukprot:2396637-Amphidinium_carterae.1
MKPPPIPTDSPASSSGVQEPPEWDSWQTRILMPAPKPLVPDTDPPTIMPASKPFLYEMPVIPPDCLVETVDVTDPEFAVFGGPCLMHPFPFPEMPRRWQAINRLVQTSQDLMPQWKE